MRLGISVIYNELCKIYGKIKEPELSSKLQKSSHVPAVLFDAPLFWDGNITLEGGAVYVISADQLPDDLNIQGQVLLIMPESLPRLKNRKNISTIAVPGADLLDLFNQVLCIFKKYNNWDMTLQRLLFSNAPMEDFLRESYYIIENPMSIHNSNFSYIARFGEYPVRGNYTTLRNAHFFDPDLLLKADKNTEESIFYSRELIYYPDPSSNQEYVFLNLFTGNTASERLVVAGANRAIYPYDYQLIIHLGKILELALSRTATDGSGRNIRRDSLLDYLSGKSHSDDKILHLKAISPFSRLEEDQRLYCIVCECQHSDLSDKYIALQLERTLVDSVCVIFEEKLVLLCSNSPSQTMDEFFEELEALFDKYNLIAGSSNPFVDFFDLRFCYLQALFALQQAMSQPSTPLISHFKEYTLDYILSYGTSIIPARLLCAGCILKLAEHDDGAAVSYCDSLRIYLDSGRNMMETARALNIKRNTFLARLERIMRFIDMDLEDEDSRLYIQISLRLVGRKTYSFDQPAQE